MANIKLTEYQRLLAYLLMKAGFERREVAEIAGNFEQEEQELKDQLLLYLWDNNPSRQEVLDFLATILESS